MLQKLLIAFCTIFALSACGGSSNSAPTPTDPPDTEQPEQPEEPEEPEEEPEEPQNGWLDMRFDEATEVDTWSFVCLDSCNATAEFEFNSEASALDVNPTWVTADDQLEVSTNIDPEIADLTGAYAHLYLYVPEAYTEAGNMVTQVFFQDASGFKAYIGYKTAEAGWNRFYFENIELGTGNNDPFGYIAEGFDLTNINRVGFQLQSSEGLVGHQGTLHIDDVIISPEAIQVEDKNGEEEPPAEPIDGAPEAPPAGDISHQFASGIDGWHINGTGNNTTTETDNIELSHDATNEALRITPVSWDLNATENYRYESRFELAEATDLSSALVRVIVYVPEAYATDGNLSFQLVATSGAGSYGDAVGGLQAGFNTIDFNLADRTEDDITAVEILGLQISSAPSDTTLVEPILVMSLDVYADGTVPEPAASNELSIAVDAGWQNDGSPATFSYDSGVVISPDWSAADQQVAFAVLEEPANLVGATVTYVIDVPAAYINDGGMVIQPFSQQNADPYAGIDDGAIPGGWNPASGLDAGENTIVHGPFSDGIPENIQRVGVRLNKQDMGEGVTGDVTIKSVTITFPE